jgi:hypothetical protein
MTAIWIHAKSVLRARIASVIVLAILFAMFSAVILSAVAGARRTGTALDRFVAQGRFSDVMVGNDLNEKLLTAIESLPQVSDHGRVSFLLLAPEESPGVPGTAYGVTVIMPVDGRWTRTFEHPKIIDGRMPSATDALEVAINEPLAKTRGVRAGDEVTFYAYGPAQLFDIFAGASPEPSGPKLRLRVTGIVRHARDIAVS